MVSRAEASFLKKLSEGLARPVSNLEITDCLVPIFLASLAWLKPFLLLASIIAPMTANSGWRRSYAALYFGFFSCCLCQTSKSKCFRSFGFILFIV